MHTNGLIVALHPDADRAAVVRTLAEAGPFTLGDAIGSRLPIVLEAESHEAAHDWHDWAARLPGVADVEVVFVHWDESEPIHVEV